MKITWYSIPIRLLGMLFAGLILAVIGGVFGLFSGFSIAWQRQTIEDYFTDLLDV